jgi:hypothetical protein
MPEKVPLAAVPMPTFTENKPSAEVVGLWVSWYLMAPVAMLSRIEKRTFTAVLEMATPLAFLAMAW